MLDTCRSWPSMYSGHLIIVDMDLAIFNNVAKVLNAMLCKCAFLLLCIQLVLVQSLKDHAQVLNMLTCGLTVHQNIIQVHSNILMKHIREHVIHQALERTRRFVRPSGMTTYLNRP